MEHNGNGYIGQSMSVNAVSAYDEGEKPLSKWTKHDIIDKLEEIQPSNIDFLKTWNLKKMKANLLEEDGWHHTSKYFNETYFYSVKSKEDLEYYTEEEEEEKAAQDKQWKNEHDAKMDIEARRIADELKELVKAGNSVFTIENHYSDTPTEIWAIDKDGNRVYMECLFFTSLEKIKEKFSDFSNSDDCYCKFSRRANEIYDENKGKND